MAEGSVSIPHAGSPVKIPLLQGMGHLWEHPEAHQHGGVQTGLIFLLFGCFLLLDGHWWDLSLLSSLVSVRTAPLVMESWFPCVILLEISSVPVCSLFLGTT